jgi:hypothetical protein
MTGPDRIDGQGVKGWLARRFAPITEINRKYRHPRIKMTRMVSVVLLFLRLYLIFLVLLLGYKFVTLLV